MDLDLTLGALPIPQALVSPFPEALLPLLKELSDPNLTISHGTQGSHAAQEALATMKISGEAWLGIPDNSTFRNDIEGVRSGLKKGLAAAYQQRGFPCGSISVSGCDGIEKSQPTARCENNSKKGQELFP